MHEPTNKQNLLEVRDLKVHFPVTGGGVTRREAGSIRAVDGVSFFGITRLYCRSRG